MVKASQFLLYVALYTAKDSLISGSLRCYGANSSGSVPAGETRFLDLDQVLMTVFTDQVQASSPWSLGEVPGGDPDPQSAATSARATGPMPRLPATIFYLASE
jgi:hypothetical protein